MIARFEWEMRTLAQDEGAYLNLTAWQAYPLMRECQNYIFLYSLTG